MARDVPHATALAYDTTGATGGDRGRQERPGNAYPGGVQQPKKTRSRGRRCERHRDQDHELDLAVAFYRPSHRWGGGIVSAWQIKVVLTVEGAGAGASATLPFRSSCSADKAISKVMSIDPLYLVKARQGGLGVLVYRTTQLPQQQDVLLKVV